jgi:ureidoglycolate hydrolase
MDERLLEIKEFQGEGYKPLVDSGAWRVAFLRPMRNTTADGITSVERHTRTDEVFVLLTGSGILFIGDGERSLAHLYTQEMDPQKIYNIKRNAWHTIFLSDDAVVLIVENRETGKENSEIKPLIPAQKEKIKTIIVDRLKKQSFL